MNHVGGRAGEEDHRPMRSAGSRTARPGSSSAGFSPGRIGEELGVHRRLDRSRTDGVHVHTTPAHSSASDLVSWSSPPLLAAYVVRPLAATTAYVEATLMIFPEPRSSIAGPRPGPRRRRPSGWCRGPDPMRPRSRPRRTGSPWPRRCSRGCRSGRDWPDLLDHATDIARILDVDDVGRCGAPARSDFGCDGSTCADVRETTASRRQLGRDRSQASGQDRDPLRSPAPRARTSRTCRTGLWRSRASSGWPVCAARAEVVYISQHSRNRSASQGGKPVALGNITEQDASTLLNDLRLGLNADGYDLLVSAIDDKLRLDIVARMTAARTASFRRRP